MASAYALPVQGQVVAETITPTPIQLEHNQSRANGSTINPTNANDTPTSDTTLHNHSHSPSRNHIHHTHAPSQDAGPLQNGYALHKSRREGDGIHRHGQQVNDRGAAYPKINTGDASRPAPNLSRELTTALLYPLPLLIASIGFASRSTISHSIPDILKIDMLKQEINEDALRGITSSTQVVSGLMQVLTLTSATLLLLGLFSKLKIISSTSDARKALKLKPMGQGEAASNALREIGLRCAGIALPLLATMTLGGQRSSHILLSAAVLISSSLRRQSPQQAVLEQWKALSASKAFIAAVLTVMIVDFASFGGITRTIDAMFGYSSLLLAVVLLPISIASDTSVEPTTLRTPSLSANPWHADSGASKRVDGSSLLSESNLLMASGASLFAMTMILSIISGESPPLSVTWLICSTMSVATAVLVSNFADLRYLSLDHPLGYMAASLLVALFYTISTEASVKVVMVNIGLISLVSIAILLEASTTTKAQPAPRHTKQSLAQHSRLTTLLLSYCEQDSLVYSVLSEKDSRRIAYFTCLNFAFMFVQGMYGYLSGSLGLLSDTVHMFFDCLGLVVGLGAAIASKWPPSADRPFGWDKLNTLAGFGNGVFLMLVSVEFVWEAIEGMLEGNELRRVKELLIVSSLGFIVNMIGLFAFGHAHAGHDHGHSHGHSHQHHDHDHNHNHDHDHDHGHKHQHDSHDHHGSGHKHDHAKHDHSHDSHSHSHGHGHEHNENMHGIFLHVAADAGGSLAVIISTALTLWYPWYFWDPLATVIIAVLIFAAAVPLVMSSGRKLLLIVPEETEYGVKNFLQEVGEVRGVIGYSSPRFWTVDSAAESEHAHGYDHGHRHGHDHSHGEEHHHHDHPHEHGSSCVTHQPAAPTAWKLTGSLHITAAPFANLEDVRERVQEIAIARQIQLLVDVECDHDSKAQMLPGHDRLR